MAFSKSKPVHVIVPPALDIKQVHRVTESVLGKLGCPQCHSGFDIRFHQEEIIVFDKALDMQSLNATRG